MKKLIVLAAAAGLAACATSAGYRAAPREGASGYASRTLEAGRHQVSYTDTDPRRARSRALLRAAEITLAEGRDWFEVTNSYVEGDGGGSRTGTSVSIGGAAGSGGYSSVGIGIGIGLPLGGSAGRVTQVLEIVTGAGQKPERPEAYDARSVEMNLRVSAK